MNFLSKNKQTLLTLLLLVSVPAWIACGTAKKRSRKQIARIDKTTAHKDRKHTPSARTSEVSVRTTLKRSPKKIPEKLRDNLNHPFAFAEEDIYSILHTLHYSLYDRMGATGIYGKPRQVFPTNMISPLARELSRAFNNVNMEQVIFFRITRKGEKTEGFAFISGYFLYWSFYQINGLTFEYKDIFKEAWEKNENKPPNWKLTPRRGQKLAKSLGLITDSREGDFMSVNLRYYKVAGTGGKKTGGRHGRQKRAERTKTPKPKGTVLDRYMALKELKREKIISDTEYERKAKALKREKKNLTIPEELKFLKFLRMDGLVTEGEYAKEKNRLLEKL